MKKIWAIVITISLSIGIFACANNANVNASGNTSTAIGNVAEKKEDEMISQIKMLLQKDVFKSLLNGKTISEAISDEIKNMTEEAKTNVTERIPGISLDLKNFENDAKTYDWIKDTIKKAIKESIEKGELNQEVINNYKRPLKLLGITIPDVEIKEGMSDSEIEKFCMAFLDVVDKFTEPAVLKILGVDVNNPESINNIREAFN